MREADKKPTIYSTSAKVTHRYQVNFKLKCINDISSLKNIKDILD